MIPDEMKSKGDPIRTTATALRASVREYYRGALTDGCGCGCGCDDSGVDVSARKMGYSESELAAVPSGANLSLGCGNPHVIAELKPGEVVLDLGSGAGLDCFLAAGKVGGTGRVIGVDMTPEMIDRSRRLADEEGYTNVEFRLGEIEHLPVADNSVNVIISNCVINLAPDKRPVYTEAFRVLKPGGRLAISDVVAVREVPEDIRSDAKLWSSCAAGALTVAELRQLLAEVGFKDINITTVAESRDLINGWADGIAAADYFTSSLIQAVKP